MILFSFVDNTHSLTALKDIPAIIVDTTPSTPPPTTRDITSARGDNTRRIPDYASPSPMDYYSPDLSPGNSDRMSHQRIRRISDMSMLSTDLGNKYMFVYFIDDDGICILTTIVDEIARRH